MDGKRKVEEWVIPLWCIWIIGKTSAANLTGCAINIGEIKVERIVFAGSILALIIWYEKNIGKMNNIRSIAVEIIDVELICV